MDTSTTASAGTQKSYCSSTSVSDIYIHIPKHNYNITDLRRAAVILKGDELK